MTFQQRLIHLRKHNVKNKAHYFHIYINAFFVCLVMVSAIFINRFVVFGNLIFPGGIYIFVLALSLLGVVVEVYGYKKGVAYIFYAVLSLLLLYFVSWFDSLLPFPQAHRWHIYIADYNYLNQAFLLGSLSEITTVFLSMFAMVYMVHAMKKSMGNEYFWARYITAFMVSVILNIVVGSMLVYYLGLRLDRVLNIAMNSFLFMILAGTTLACPLDYLAKWLKITRNNV